jgi:hypothetical protein
MPVDRSFRQIIRIIDLVVVIEGATHRRHNRRTCATNNARLTWCLLG